MAKRGKRSKKKGLDINVAVVVMILISILLAILIYTKSGYIGEHLSPILGGIMGAIKYIIPIGTFLIAIYMTSEEKEYLISKLIQYGIFLLCIATVLSVFQFSNGNLDETGDFSSVVERGYELGETNSGGGAILLVFIFGIKPAEMIADFIDTKREEKEERRAEREEAKLARIQEDVEERKETKKERRLREKEEQKREAEQLAEQLTINLNDDSDNDGKRKDKKLKKYDHTNDDLIPFNINGRVKDKKEEKEKSNPDEIEANLFKEEQETKEEKVKQVLQLEHTLTVEDEHYEFPPIQLLAEGDKKAIKGGKKAVADTATRLQKTLYSFGVSAKVENVSVGPAITRYELKPAEGVRVSKIANLADDIALSLAAETIRIEAPIPGKQAVGIEVPNKENEIVPLRDIIDSDSFKNHKSKLAFALGKDVAGEEVVADIAKMPHVLIAGATGSGKSVCINTLIASIIYKAKPSEVKLVMVDPKVVELSVYNGIPHLLTPVVTDPKKAVLALNWAVREMDDRYKRFADTKTRDISRYNELHPETAMPFVVIIIDELADLMMVASSDVEESICRLAQKARACGMHLVLATQRPSVDGLSVPADSVGTKVLHQFLGAEKAKRDFGIDDDEILEAVRCHTTAKPAMTVFEKLVYTADSTSYDREYDPIPVIRAIADKDFEKGFLSVLEYTYMKLTAAGGAIYPLTEEAVKYYLPDIAGWA